MNYLLLLIPIGLLSLFVWATVSLRKTAIKDWATLEELKEKCKKVKSKEDIEEFHKEFNEKASKIYNKHIYAELLQIDGYLRGLYQQYKTKN